MIAWINHKRKSICKTNFYVKERNLLARYIVIIDELNVHFANLLPIDSNGAELLTMTINEIKAEENAPNDLVKSHKKSNQ